MAKQIRIGLTPTVARKVFVTFKGRVPPVSFDVPLDATEFVITESMLGDTIADYDPWYVEVRDYSAPLAESSPSTPVGGFVGDSQANQSPHNVNQPCPAFVIGYEDV